MTATVPKDKRVVTEDYFRVLKERREADSKLNKKTAHGVSKAGGYESLNNETVPKHSPEKYGMP